MSARAIGPHLRLGLALGLTLTLGSACMASPNRAEGYGTRAPRREPKLEQVPVNGYAVRIKFDDKSVVKGELLSAEVDGEVIVRTRHDEEVHRSFSGIARVRVWVDRNAGKWMGGIGGVTGALVPLSFLSGLYSVILIPIVVVAGGVSIGIVAGESRVVLRGEQLVYLPQYARWPQGPPEPPPPGPDDPIQPIRSDEPTAAPVVAPDPAPIELAPLR